MQKTENNMETEYAQKWELEVKVGPFLLQLGQRRQSLWVLAWCHIFVHQNEGDKGTTPCGAFPRSTATL